MALSVGEKLGAYEILGPLGVGGMGEVYRARDRKLGREVAIKVLLETLARDPERMARFEREARVLASLDHPNIAHIFGLEESTDVRAIVMALVEGPTLADRIATAPIPIDEAARIATQIIEALEYAHDCGVIHRDLKPANIKITADGAVKVLDFGLAKVLDDDQAQTSSVASPTLTLGHTRAGVILGTAAYMSPEQAVGKTADRRSDIFSFGVVLYEMLTGQRAFMGDSAGETLVSVAKDDPDWSKLPAGMPASMEKLLRRCLVKDRKRRLQAIGEARIMLEKGETEAPAPVLAKPRNTILWPALATVLGITAAAVAFVHYSETPPEMRVVSSTLLAPEGMEFDFSAPPGPLPALSPDGTRIIFGAKPKDGKMQLWIRRLDSPTAQPLPGTEGAYYPFWSPDSRWVAFGQDLKLRRIDVQGGPPVSITDLPAAFGGGSWNAEGTIVFGVNGSRSPIYRVASAGGAATPITPPESNGSVNHRYPWFLPDGRHFLYTIQQDGDIPVRVASLDEPGKAGKTVAQSHSNAVYSQGHLLYLRENTLMAQPFDPQNLDVHGEAVPLAEGVPTYTSPSRLAAFTVSSGGLLVHQTGANVTASKLRWKDRTGKTLGTLGEPVGAISAIEISPDGTRVAATETRSGNTDIWIYDAVRGVPTRFTFDVAADRNAVWSPDGGTLYFDSGRGGKASIFRKASNGTGEDTSVSDDASRVGNPAVSLDGRFLLYTRQGEKTSADLWMLPLDPAGAKALPFLETPFLENEGRFSPDGHWVAYRSRESGRDEVYAAPFPGPGGKHQISANGGLRPRWRRDGKEIYFLTPDGQLMAAEVGFRNGTLEVGAATKLFDGINTVLGLGYDVSPDGQKFLVVDAGAAPSSPLTLLQNWTAGLRK